MKVKLRQIAHARAGDKGDISNVSLIVDDRRHFPIVCEQMTAQRVKAWFGELVRGDVERYEVPGLLALNFVFHAALSGGVTRSLALDPHGKSRSSLLLEMDIDLPDAPPG